MFSKPSRFFLNFSWILLLGAYTSCTTKPPMDEMKFKQILFELHECEAYLEFRAIGQDSVALASCRTSVLARHQVSPETMTKTINHYLEHPERFELIYDSILLRSDLQIIP